MDSPIVYTLVAFWEKTGSKLVADYPKDANYYRDITLATIDGLKNFEDENVSVNKGKYTVHILIGELYYACITLNPDCPSTASFLASTSHIFLEKLRTVYRELPILADLSLDLNEYFTTELSEPLKRIVEEHNNLDMKQIPKLQEELSEVRVILMEAIQNLINRGQRLEELVRKTQTLRIAVRTDYRVLKQKSNKSSYVMIITSIAVLVLFLSFVAIVLLYINALSNK